MVEAIRDSVSEEQLAETLGHVVSKLLLRAWGHLAFPHGQLNKEFVKAITQAFKDKVEDFVEQDRSKTAALVKYVVDVIFDAIYDTIKDFQAMHISSMAVQIATKLLNGMFSGFATQLKEADLNLSQNVELSAVVLAHFLLDTHPLRE